MNIFTILFILNIQYVLVSSFLLHSTKLIYLNNFSNYKTSNILDKVNINTNNKQLRNIKIYSSENDENQKFSGFDDMMTKVTQPVLVDFYAQWCGPCKMMAPVLEDVAGRLEKYIKVAKVDTDKSPRLSSRYNIESLPTLILFHKGEIIEKFIGYRNADDLEKEVAAVLKRFNLM